MAEYIQTRLTNPSPPSTPKKRGSSMARKRKSTRRKSTSARRPVKVKMASTKRRRNPSKRRKTTTKRRRSMASTRRRRNPGAPKRRNTRAIGNRRKNPAFDWEGTLVAFAGVAAGAFVSDYVNDGMNNLFSGLTQNNNNAAPMLGALKLIGSFGILAAAKAYEDQMPRSYGAVELPIDEMVIAATAVSIKSGIELLMGGTNAQAELAAAQAAAGTHRMHGRRPRRRRMRGTIISSPELATQLRMGQTRSMLGTATLPMHGEMAGSLDVYPQEQNALLRMQGTNGGVRRSRSRAL